VECLPVRRTPSRTIPVSERIDDGGDERQGEDVSGDTVLPPAVP
jgi:hypothetical protein